LALAACTLPQQPAIDRPALVSRHNPHVTTFDTLASLGVGNGNFAFTVDATGLQTFPHTYRNGIPLTTQSNRSTCPQSFRLGMVGIELDNDTTPANISGVEQSLDLWRGEINSRFTWKEQPFEVHTVCHPTLDMIAATIISPARTGANFRFASTATEVMRFDRQSALLKSTLDDDTTVCYVNICWEGAATLSAKEKNYFVLTAEDDTLRFTCLFSANEPTTSTPSYEETQKEAAHSLEAFWTEGAAVDFSHCTDPRARELERRVVLSQYLLHTQGGIDKSPTNVMWWQQAWLGLWGHDRQLDSILREYETMEVRHRPLLIYLAELDYRANPSPEVIARHNRLVQETAAYMQSFATFDVMKGRYILKGLTPAQETLPPAETVNPPFELSYWHFALPVAQRWRERAGQPRNAQWDALINKLSPLAYTDYGLYLAAESAVDTYNDARFTSNHPMILGAVGMLPMNNLIRADYMRNTLLWALDNWNWNDACGWDYPMTAMNAARMGLPERAVDALLMRRRSNTYLPNGHNYQDNDLPLYLPGNGGLLAAVAMMCAGWDGSKTPHPGFPQDGTWDVRWEGLKPLP
jgi:hypothetical protein